MQEFQIGANEAGQRFDKYLKKLLPEAPAGFVYKMLWKKNITLNGEKADGSEKLGLGDGVKLFFSEDTFAKFSSPQAPQPAAYPYVPLDIVYEDQDILVINKPCGMLSQKAAPGDVSANEYIIGYLLKEEQLSVNDSRVMSLCDSRTRPCQRFQAASAPSMSHRACWIVWKPPQLPGPVIEPSIPRSAKN